MTASLPKAILSLDRSYLNQSIPGLSLEAMPLQPRGQFARQLASSESSTHMIALPSQDDLREGKRKTTTRITNCPFSVLARESSEGWTLKYRPEVRFAVHNHEPSLHPSTHPIHRQLSSGISQLAALSDTGLAPKEIQTVVRQSGSLATRCKVLALWQL